MGLQTKSRTKTLDKNQAMAILEEIESLLGPSASAAVFIKIEEEYLGNELDILAALMTRSDLVERAFVSILENGGREVFLMAVNGALAKNV